MIDGVAQISVVRPHYSRIGADSSSHRLYKCELVRADNGELYWTLRDRLKFSSRPFSLKYCKENYINYIGVHNCDDLYNQPSVIIKGRVYTFYIKYNAKHLNDFRLARRKEGDSVRLI